MKNTLLLILLFISLSAFGQSYSKNAMNAANVQQSTTDTYIDWRLSNQGGWGIPSFYWKIVRTFTGIGNYQFDVYFCTNSFRLTGDKASTYLWGIFVNVDGSYVTQTPHWILFKEVYYDSLSSFTTSNPNPKIYISWQGMSIY